MVELAINGGEPVRRKAFAQFPTFDERELSALQEVLESGIWGGSSSQRRRSGQLLHHAHTPWPATRPNELWTGLTHAPCRPASAIVTGLPAVRPPV